MRWPFQRVQPLDLKSAAQRAGVRKVDVLRAALAGLIKISLDPAAVDAWIAAGRPQGRRGRRYRPR